MLARGEQRGSGSGYTRSTEKFDCSAEGTVASGGCRDGVLEVEAPAGPEGQVAIRFELPDGSFTDWQTVDLDVTSTTDPDFNGPDCPCTFYTATAAPITVPADARID